MNQLWAPWRMAYINGIDGKDKGCVFCTKPKGKRRPENLILYAGKECFVIMNLFPYNNGHLMVVPYAHAADIGVLDKSTSGELGTSKSGKPIIFKNGQWVYQ